MFEILKALLGVRKAAVAHRGGYYMHVDRDERMLVVQIPVSEEDIEFYDNMSLLVG